MFKQTIRANIVTIFLFLVGMVSFSLLAAQYFFNQNLAIDSTTKIFHIISKNISKQVEKDNNRINNILKANVDNTHLYEKITFDYKHPATLDFIQMMSINRGIYSMYFSQKDGAFFEVINMEESTLLYDLYKAPQKTKWTVIININNKAQYTFLDMSHNKISSYTHHKKYNPLSRPWYLAAVNSQQPIMTEPYLFTNLKETGATYAVQLKKEGSVFALDYTLKRLNKLLSLQNFEENSEIFLFNKHGSKLASSTSMRNEAKETILSSKNHIDFTQAETQYVNALEPLIVSNEEDWAPFDFQSAGTPQGYSVDLIKLISKKSGLKVEFTNGHTWEQIINTFKAKDIDIVQSVYKTPQREKLGTFTEPLYSFKNYFITRKNSKGISSIEEIKSQKIAVVKGWAIEKFLATNYPNIEVVTFDNLTTSILALSQGKVDVMIETKETFNYLHKQLYINNLTLNGWFKEFDNNKPRSIYMMIQANNPLLLSIINKTLRSITKEEKKQLTSKWFSTNSTGSEKQMIDPELMNSLLKKNKNIIIYDNKNTNYFSMFMPLHDNVYLGIKIGSENLLKPYYQNMKYSFVISLLLLLIAVPVIFFATNIIIKPIKALIAENDDVKYRRFDMVEKIDTNIVEFVELSDSLVSMSQSIHEYQKSQEELLNSIIKLIAEAVDAKSPYTGGHCERVPEIAKMLVAKASASNEGVFKDFVLESEDDLREFEIGSWLHDCGKVTTPEYVVDKSTKLETINDRIHEVRTRFEVLWRDAQIQYLQAKLNGKSDADALVVLNATQAQLLEDFEFVASANVGGEYMSPDKQERIRSIAKQEWTRHFDDALGLGEVEILRYDKENAPELPATEQLLSDKKQHIIKRENFDYASYERDGFKEEVPEHLYNYGEVYNLCIAKGTLSPEERYKINEHVILTIKMLEKIPFPSHMTKIPEYAGTHHETLVGTGYPRKLTEDALSIPARIMAMADVFEALTASDRPYKKAKTLSASVKILSFMVKDRHLDSDIFKLFLKSDLHNVYAKKYLKPEQIDEVDIQQYL